MKVGFEMFDFFSTLSFTSWGLPCIHTEWRRATRIKFYSSGRCWWAACQWNCCTLPAHLSKALLALLLHNPCVSFLKYLTWILLLVSHRDGRAVRTPIQIYFAYHGRQFSIIVKKTLFSSQVCKTRGKQNTVKEYSVLGGTGWIWGKGWIIYGRTMFNPSSWLLPAENLDILTHSEYSGPQIFLKLLHPRFRRSRLP